jgi:hypothetical protein
MLALLLLAGTVTETLATLFNLTPFEFFDKLKVIRWDKAAWLVLFALERCSQYCHIFKSTERKAAAGGKYVLDMVR